MLITIIIILHLITTILMLFGEFLSTTKCCFFTVISYLNVLERCPCSVLLCLDTHPSLQLAHMPEVEHGCPFLELPSTIWQTDDRPHICTSCILDEDKRQIHVQLSGRWKLSWGDQSTENLWKINVQYKIISLKLRLCIPLGVHVIK